MFNKARTPGVRPAGHLRKSALRTTTRPSCYLSQSLTDWPARPRSASGGSGRGLWLSDGTWGLETGTQPVIDS